MSAATDKDRPIADYRPVWSNGGDLIVTSHRPRLSTMIYRNEVDKIEFIKRIKQVVANGAIEGAIDNLNNPPGRNPDSQLLIQSSWFKELNDTDREMVSKLISEAVHEAVFGFLCVLDGVRSITDEGESNILQLSHNGVQLNDSSGEFLHDIYKNV